MCCMEFKRIRKFNKPHPIIENKLFLYSHHKPHIDNFLLILRT
jgi:hypothetical protein